jgi:acetylornithine deacetylase/succinyl-diaminopimelate desuccinylase-like protein
MTKLPLIRAVTALCSVCALAAPVASQAQTSPLLDEQAIRQAAVASFPDYLALLALPNDALVEGDHLQKNAAWLRAALSKRGFVVHEVANGGRPILFANYPADPAKKTVLFYMHFDGQPVTASQWSQPDPFKPVLKKKGADGKWAVVDMQQLLRSDFDPELRVFARASSDDKGPIMMFLAALDLMRQQGQAPAVNVKLILDSEEEISSPGIGKAIAQEKDFVRADALIIHDGPAHASGRPTAVFGNRGVQTLTLTVFGPKAPLHSGHYGNYVPNPALNLARLLVSMKDAQGRVIIPGYYSSTRISAADKRVLAASDDDEAALRRRVGIAQPDQVAGNYQESLQYPSLNIRGMAAGGVGKQAANIVPKEAVAELDVRTTSEANSTYLTGLIRQFIAKQGYQLLDHEPTDEERARFPLIARLQEGLPAEAARQPMDAPVRRWVEQALTTAHQDGAAGQAMRPVLLRASGGTVPTHEIVSPLIIPFALVTVVNADNNQHTYDENLRMGNYLSGMRSMLGLLTTPFPGK